MKRFFVKMGLAFLLGINSILFVLGIMTQLGSTVRVAYAVGPRYVAPGGSDSGNNCANSATPCATIQHAVDMADPGDEIKIATGAYTGVSTRMADLFNQAITQVVYISKSLTIQGGYITPFTQLPNLNR